jgi:pantoate kinase
MLAVRMLAVLVLVLAGPAIRAGELGTKKVLTLEVAKEIAAAGAAYLQKMLGD